MVLSAVFTCFWRISGHRNYRFLSNNPDRDTTIYRDTATYRDTNTCRDTTIYRDQ